MKYLKNFEELNEGKGRMEIKDNHVIAGNVNMPQFWTTSPDYMKVDNDKDPQQVGLDPKQLIAPVGNNYTYIVDSDDHVDVEKIKKLVEPHVKKFSDFGFDPSKSK